MLKLLTALVLSLLPAWVGAQNLERAVITHFPQPGLAADQLGVIVNDDDPDSVAIAAYYLEKRGIPATNLIHVRFKPGVSTLSREEFIKLKRRVDRLTPKSIQAYALTWTKPYRVDCMSITSAFAFGFDPARKDLLRTRPIPHHPLSGMQRYHKKQHGPARSLPPCTSLLNNRLPRSNFSTGPKNTLHYSRNSDRYSFFNERLSLFPARYDNLF